MWKTTPYAWASTDTEIHSHPPGPLLTCSSMIKGKCTHTHTHISTSSPFLSLYPFTFIPPYSTSLTPSLSLSLYCTQAQHGSGCNHRWTQFQGQFKDYLLSSVNKSTDRLTLWMFIWNLMDRALNASQLVYSRRDSLLSFSFVLVLFEGGGIFFSSKYKYFWTFCILGGEKKHRKQKIK